MLRSSHKKPRGDLNKSNLAKKEKQQMVFQTISQFEGEEGNLCQSDL